MCRHALSADAVPEMTEGKPDNPMPSSLPLRIGTRLRFAQAVVWGDLPDTFNPFGFRLQHYAASKIIEGNPGYYQQDLGGALRISRSNLVMLIDQLVAQKLIKRRQNSEDRRSNALHLSAHGVALLPELDRAQRAHEERLPAVVDEHEPQALITLLGKPSKLSKVGTC